MDISKSLIWKIWTWKSVYFLFLLSVYACTLALAVNLLKLNLTIYLYFFLNWVEKVFSVHLTSM